MGTTSEIIVSNHWISYKQNLQAALGFSASSFEYAMLFITLFLHGLVLVQEWTALTKRQRVWIGLQAVLFSAAVCSINVLEFILFWGASFANNFFAMIAEERSSSAKQYDDAFKYLSLLALGSLFLYLGVAGLQVDIGTTSFALAREHASSISVSTSIFFLFSALFLGFQVPVSGLGGMFRAQGVTTLFHAAVTHLLLLAVFLKKISFISGVDTFSGDNHIWIDLIAFIFATHTIYCAACVFKSKVATEHARWIFGYATSSTLFIAYIASANVAVITAVSYLIYISFVYLVSRSKKLLTQLQLQSLWVIGALAITGLPIFATGYARFLEYAFYFSQVGDQYSGMHIYFSWTWIVLKVFSDLLVTCAVWGMALNSEEVQTKASASNASIGRVIISSSLLLLLVNGILGLPLLGGIFENFHIEYLHQFAWFNLDSAKINSIQNTDVASILILGVLLISLILSKTLLFSNDANAEKSRTKVEHITKRLRADAKAELWLIEMILAPLCRSVQKTMTAINKDRSNLFRTFFINVRRVSYQSVKFVDRNIFEKLFVHKIVDITKSFGDAVRLFHTGSIQAYWIAGFVLIAFLLAKIFINGSWI